MPEESKLSSLPDPWVCQTDYPRVAVEGRLARLDKNGRVVLTGRCTLAFIRRPEGWLVYRFALAEDVANAALLTDADVRKITDRLVGVL